MREMKQGKALGLLDINKETQESSAARNYKEIPP